MTLIIPEPGNDKWHLPVKRPAVTEVNQYSEMDDTADSDTNAFLCLDPYELVDFHLQLSSLQVPNVTHFITATI